VYDHGDGDQRKTESEDRANVDVALFMVLEVLEVLEVRGVRALKIGHG
jgi:hypothetical protein